jgi:hypothetical protein
LRVPTRKNSSRGPLRKRRRIGSIAPVKFGLKNAGEGIGASHEGLLH